MSLFAREVRSGADAVVARALGVRAGVASSSLSADQAMRLSVWWQCVHLLASTISQLPVDVYRRGPDGARKEIAAPPVVSAPSMLVSQIGWRYQMMVSLMQRGNAYGVVVARDRLGYPTGIELVHPDTVQVKQAHQLAPPTYRVDRTELDASDVFHLAAFLAPGSVVGLSPLRYARAAMGSGLAALDYAETFWRDGGHPTAVLSSEQAIDGPTAERMKQRFKGATAEDRLAVLGSGLTYAAVQVSPEDAGWLHSINATDLMICRFAGVPPEFLSIPVDGSSVTYANREQRALDFLTFAVQWWLSRVEEAWSALLPRGTYLKHNAAALLRTDVKTRVEVAAIRLQNGITNVDYERELDDLPPIPDGAGQVYKQASAPVAPPAELQRAEAAISEIRTAMMARPEPQQLQFTMPETRVDVAAPVVNVAPSPAPDVHVAPAEIRVEVAAAEAPVVNVAPAHVHVEPRFDMPAPQSAPQVSAKTVERDAEGRITRIIEESQ